MNNINLTPLNRVILTVLLFAVSLLSLVFSSCSHKNEYGIGPVKDEIKLTAVDANLSTKGKQLFDTKCGSCHRFNSRLIGPQLKDVTNRRRPEWIMNQILNPMEMMQKDPVAKKLLAEYKVPMITQDVTHDDARALLEYFRAVDENKITEVK